MEVDFNTLMAKVGNLTVTIDLLTEQIKELQNENQKLRDDLTGVEKSKKNKKD